MVRHMRGAARAAGLAAVTILALFLVVDRPGGSAVEGATVLLRSFDLQLTATTGNDGRFQFTNLPIPAAGGPPSRVYELLVSKPDWATVQAPVAVKRAETVRVTLVQPRRNPAFAYDTTLPVLQKEGHIPDISKWDVTATDEAGGSGLALVGWLMDYGWGYIRGSLLNGSPTFTGTFNIPHDESGPGEHTYMFIAIDRAGNTTISPLWSNRSSSSPGLDTPPTMAGAVAATLTNSVLELPPTLAGSSGIGGSVNRSGLSQPQAGSQRTQPGYSHTLRQWIARTIQQGGGPAGGSVNGKQARPAALPPGSDAFLFTLVGWRQTNLNGVAGFRIYRNGRFALDRLTTELVPGTDDIYETEDYAAELVPGHTTTYADAAFGNGKESAPSASRSVVPLPVLGKPEPLGPGNGTVHNGLPTLQWTAVTGESVFYAVEIHVPGIGETELRETNGTVMDLEAVPPPEG